MSRQVGSYQSGENSPHSEDWGLMSDWKNEIGNHLVGLNLSATREVEIIEELSHHLEDRYQELRATGTTDQEAHRIALSELIDSELLRRELQRARRFVIPEPIVFAADKRGNMIGYIYQDLRYAGRMLRKYPGFTAIAMLTLALGIGATTAIFSVFYATLFEPMPYPSPDQLVMVWSQVKDGHNSVSAGDYLDWKERSTSFQYMGAASGGLFNLATTDRPEQILAQVSTPGLLNSFGYSMFLGRDFLPEEAEPGRNHVVVLTHRLWSQYFGADKNIIGKQIRMNGELYAVVGVTPPGQADRLPFQMWLPLTFRLDQINHEFHWLIVIGRLKPNVSIARAQAEMQTIATQITQEHPQSNTNWNVSVEPLHNNFLPQNTIRSLWLLLCTVGFLLLMACVNIANMLLARGTTRQKEVALRSALGATKTRLFSQLLIESLSLALVGGISGILLAWALVKLIVATIPPLLPSEAEIRISIPVLLFTLVATMFSGILFGCVPALQATRLDLNETLKQGGRTGMGGRGLRRALVVIEFALALTILAGGGLALRSFWNLTRVDLGIRPDHVLTFDLPVPPGRLSGSDEINTYYRRLLETIEAVPGVEKATAATGTPLRGTGFGMSFSIVGQPPVNPSSRPGAGFQMVTPGYFDTFNIRVVKGRSFTDQDVSASQRVAMVNENFVNKYFSDVDPLTQRVSVDSLVPGTQKVGQPVEWQIVGVFHNVRNGDSLRSDYPEIYVPFSQSPWPQTSVAVRTAGDPNQMTKSIAAAVNSLDPDLPLAGVKTMDQIIDEILQVDRFGMVLFGGFAVLALVLAAVGIYGVMAFVVAQRIPEFGIRMALGAGQSQVLSLVLREGVLLAIIGTVVGLAGAYMIGRTMQSNFYGVGAMDFWAFSAVSLILFFAALFACFFPARRASKVDPMVALRYE